MHSLYTTKTQNSEFLVQTNTDRGLPDPDDRRTAAEVKLKYMEKTADSVRYILESPPNFNRLTLMTVLMQPLDGVMNVSIWS